MKNMRFLMIRTWCSGVATAISTVEAFTLSCKKLSGFPGGFFHYIIHILKKNSIEQMRYKNKFQENRY
jgi:hypothetical protein